MTKAERQARAQRLGLADKLPSELERAFDTYVLQLAPQIAGLYFSDVSIPGVPQAWRYDKVFQQARVIVEVHGGEWSGGRHVRGGGFIEDRKKMNAAIEAGWLVLEFTGTMLRDNPAGCVEQLVKVLRMRGADV